MITSFSPLLFLASSDLLEEICRGIKLDPFGFDDGQQRGGTSADVDQVDGDVWVEIGHRTQSPNTAPGREPIGLQLLRG
jgi:hypothetical protein